MSAPFVYGGIGGGGGSRVPLVVGSYQFTVHARGRCVANVVNVAFVATVFMVFRNRHGRKLRNAANAAIATSRFCAKITSG